MSTAPNYLCVFHALAEVEDDVRDLGDDPDFRAPATWGICRPNTRRAVREGSHVFFLGYLKNPSRYLVKGWIRVGGKLGYLDALDRFGDRPNVIVRDAKTVTGPSARPGYWKREDLRAAAQARYGPEPAWLTVIQVGERMLVQSPDDEHELDNWKCQRMFMCQRRQFLRCLDLGHCERESEFADLTGYIVASEWQDVGRLRAPWELIAPARLQGVPLRTPYGQHNHMLLTQSEVDGLKSAINELARSQGTA